MTFQTKTPVIIVILLVLIQFKFSFASTGGQEGGGGGFVHDSFIFYGKRVLYFLKNTERGRAIVSSRSLNLCRLKNTLDENLLYVYSGKQMLDHRGSLVDAYSYFWSIYILESRWESFFRDNIDIYHLVFKEMLRSEKSYFEQAIDISESLNPFFFEEPSEEKWKNFLKWFEKDDYSCLDEKDRIQREKNLSLSILSNKYKAPSCFNLEETQNESIADKILRSVKETKCQIEISECSVQTEKVNEKNKLYLMKSIFWKGIRLYSLPIIVKNLNSKRSYRPYPSEDFVNDLVKMKLKQLERGNVCIGPSNDKSGDVPEFLTVKTDILSQGFLDFELIRNDSFRVGLGKRSSIIGAIGNGSIVKLLTKDVEGENVSNNPFGGRFIKVRLLTNTLSREVPNTPKAPIGTEGWIMTSATDYIHYLDHDFSILSER